MSSASDFLYNLHMHFITSEETSEGYLGPRLPFNYAVLHTLQGALWLASWLYKGETLRNYARMVDRFNNSTMRQNYLDARSYDQCQTKHIGLAMDMIAIKGEIKRDLYTQITDYGKMKQEFPNFEWFVAIDPTRDEHECKALLNLALDNGAIGYKFYGSLGHLPSHPNMVNIIIPFCLEHKWPITSHCSSAITHASSKRILVVGLDIDCKEINEFWTFKKKDDYLVFNNPRVWYPVLKLFPGLHVNFAHFGGDNKDWRNYIVSLMYTFHHVYADLSYTFTNIKVLDEILYEASNDNLLRSRILYGTDYWMVLLVGEYRKLLARFHERLGAENLVRFGMKNALKFLRYE